MQYGKIKCEILSHAFLYFEMKKSSMPLVWVCAHTSKPSGYNSFKISSHRKCWKQTSFAWIHWPIFLKEILPLGFYLHWNRNKQSSIVSSQNLEDYPSSCTTDLLHKKNYRHPWPQRHTSELWNILKQRIVLLFLYKNQFRCQTLLCISLHICEHGF